MVEKLFDVHLIDKRGMTGIPEVLKIEAMMTSNEAKMILPVSDSVCISSIVFTGVSSINTQWLFDSKVKSGLTFRWCHSNAGEWWIRFGIIRRRLRPLAGYENIRFISIDPFHLLLEYEVGDLKISICCEIIL